MLKKLILAILIVLAVGLAGFLIIAWEPAIEETTPPSRVDFSEEQIARGAQLAAVGDCSVCHTVEGGEPYAGGVPIPTPFGTIYSTNITPEPDTGIGTWTEEAFVRSMREGIARDGSHLYPAFPYTHYTKTTDEDLAAIYAFLMTRQPVEATAPENELPFPLGFRPLLAGWNLLFLDEGVYEPVEGQSDAWNQGAYLVAGLGHCSSCHTPRNFLGAEIEDERFDGGEGEGWHGPALNEETPAVVPWTEEAMYVYLRDDIAEFHGKALGPMREVTVSLLDAAEEDVRAMSVYLASLQPEAEETAVAEAIAAAREFEFGPAPTLQNHDADPGATIFAGSCAICHHQGGVYPAIRPVDLAFSSAVQGPDPRNLIHVIREGVHPPDGMAGAMMPGFAGTLTDDQLEQLVAFVRDHFSDEPAWENLSETIRTIIQGEGEEAS